MGGLEFLNFSGMNLGVFLLYALVFIATLSLIVFVHEYGHFQVGRWCGVKAEVFSIGFGREICGWTDRQGTRWRLAWLPLGGYVKFAGDANGASMPDRNRNTAEPGDFHAAAVWRRALIVVAGPAANYLMAIVILVAVYMTAGYPYGQSRVDEVLAGSAAEKAGLQAGDIILSINGTPVRSFYEVQETIMTRMGEGVTMVVDRDGSQHTLSAVIGEGDIDAALGGKVKVGRLGITHNDNRDRAQVMVPQPPLQALELAIDKCWKITETTIRYVVKLFSGRESTDKLGGIGSMANVVGNAATIGLAGFLLTVALLSVSIGLINLFPIPILDGGHLVFYAIEAVLGRPVGPVAQEWSFRIGFAVVVAMMLIANLNDAFRIGWS